MSQYQASQDPEDPNDPNREEHDRGFFDFSAQLHKEGQTLDPFGVFELDTLPAGTWISPAAVGRLTRHLTDMMADGCTTYLRIEKDGAIAVLPVWPNANVGSIVQRAMLLAEGDESLITCEREDLSGLVPGPALFVTRLPETFTSLKELTEYIQANTQSPLPDAGFAFLQSLPEPGERSLSIEKQSNVIAVLREMCHSREFGKTAHLAERVFQEFAPQSYSQKQCLEALWDGSLTAQLFRNLTSGVSPAEIATFEELVKVAEAAGDASERIYITFAETCNSTTPHLVIRSVLKPLLAANLSAEISSAAAAAIIRAEAKNSGVQW